MLTVALDAIPFGADSVLASWAERVELRWPSLVVPISGSMPAERGAGTDTVSVSGARSIG